MSKTKVLDNGYVELIEVWGRDKDCEQTETGIIGAARQSTQGSFRGWDQDERLLNYLWSHKHTTPFEFCGATIEVQLPIFVARQWQRHRTLSYNEASARYTELDLGDYLPDVDRLRAHLSQNKQASSDRIVAEGGLGVLRFVLEQSLSAGRVTYRYLLDAGVPRETARGVLTMFAYTKMRVTGNLLNWCRFLRLRDDSHAQWETQQYAKAVKEQLRDYFPRVIALLEEGEGL